MRRAVSGDRIAPGKDTCGGETHRHTPASRATVVARSQSMYPSMRCMMGACCSGQGAVGGIRYDVQTLDNATCRYTSNTVALVSGKHGICCDVEGKLPLI